MYKNKIKKYRKEKGLTMTEMANEIGISVGYLCHLEKGSRSNPSMRNNGENCRNIGKKYN